MSSLTKILLVETTLKYDKKAAFPENPCASNSVLEGCTKTLPFSWSKYRIVFASGSSSTAPDMLEENFLSGNWMRAIWGVNALAVRARSTIVLVVGDVVRLDEVLVLRMSVDGRVIPISVSAE